MSDKKTILINYKGENVESVSAGPRDLVRLNPGVNTVDAAMWKRIIDAAEIEQKNKKSKTKGGVLFLIDNDLVSEVPAMGSEETDETGLVDITKVNVKNGIDIVRAEADLESLGVYLAAEKGKENRATLVKAITGQIDALETAAEEEAAKKED
jgi:hypothetical protein